MGEIADAYIWGEMNGRDMDDPQDFVDYYNDDPEDMSEFWKEQRQEYKKRCERRNSEFEPLLIKAGAIKKSEAIYMLGDWLCYPTKGFAMDKRNTNKRTSLKKLLSNIFKEKSQIEKLEDKLKIAIEALEFYGNKENKHFSYWQDLEDDKFAYVVGVIETGYKARKALEKIRGK